MPAPLPVRRWQNAPGAAQPLTIEDGRRVAIKHCKKPNGGGGFQRVETIEAFQQAGKWAPHDKVGLGFATAAMLEHYMG